MDKIKIQSEPIQEKKIRVGKQMIFVKPYLSTEDISNIINVFTSNNSDELADLAVAQCVFDMLVVDTCTNIFVDGISSEKIGEDVKISVDLDEEKVSAFDNSRIIEYIKPHLSNYKDAFCLLIKTLEMRNINNAIKAIGNNIPDVENMGKIIQDSMNTLVEFKEKDPETFNKILNQGINKQIREQAAKEIKEEKKHSNKKPVKK
jgi:hypothetical protein